MTQTITPDELVSLNRTMASLYQAAERLEAAEMDRDHLAGILEKIMQIFDGHPDLGPSDFAELPLEVSVLHEMYNEELAKNDRLLCENESLKGEVVTAGNHAACRLNVLKGIYHILGSDGGPTGENVLTGVPLQLARLPKQIGQLLADVTTWRDEFVKAENKVKELLRENETLARNMPPEPPMDTPMDTPVVRTYDPACFQTTKVIGQQWCKTDRATTDLVNFAFKFDMQTHYIVLCDVHQDITTGALTYHPVGVKDLPTVQ